MRRNRKGRLAAVLAAAVLAAGIGGCGKDGNTQDTQGAAAGGTELSAPDETVGNPETAENQTAQGVSAEGSAAMGRYMESEIALPEGIMRILDIRELEDGTLRLAAGGSESMIWDSKDGGAAWEQKGNIEEALKLEEGTSVYDARISPDGSVLAFWYEDEENEEEYSVGTLCFGKILPDGTAKQITLAIPEMEEGSPYGSMVSQMAYMESGKILVSMIGMEPLYLLDDESGELLETLNEEETYCEYFQTGAGRIFLFSGSDGVTVLDYRSGKESAEDETLKETLEANSGNLTRTSTSSNPVVMCSGNEEGTLYFANDEGMYSYSVGGSVVEQIADGKLNSLAKPSVSLCSMLVLNDGSVLLSVLDDGNPKLLRFVYDGSVPAVPDTEIKVYALENNAAVQQAISMFQTQNQKYYVNLEIGMSGDDAVTASDALRTLNTEIMAGNGPDVLILDGMPMESYIEKGVLKDISGIYNEVLNSDGLQENVAGIYQKEGAVYAVPSRFKVPVLIGDAETIAQIGDLESLGSTAKQLRAADDEAESILHVSDIYWLQNTFYGAYSPLMLAEDGAVDTQMLTGYMTVLKTLFDLNHYREEEMEYRMMTVNGDDYDFSLYISTQGLVQETEKLQLMNLGSGNGLADVTSVMGLKPDIDYRLAPVSGKKVFIPGTIVGVSAKSSQTEGAEEFVKFMLSELAQSVNQESGFPVNKKALDTELFAEKLAKGELSEDERIIMTGGSSWMDEDGVFHEFSFDTLVPGQEQVDHFKELIDSLDTPSLTDAVMKELIAEQAGKCITGEITAEEAVNTVSQKMDLYLAE